MRVHTTHVHQIKIDLVSVMCDNKYRWIARKKNDDGDFVIHYAPSAYAFSNFHIPHHKDDLEWNDGCWRHWDSGVQYD